MKIFAYSSTAIALALTVVLFALEVRLAERIGLHRLVFSGVELNGAPLVNDISGDVTLDFLDDDARLPRRFFSARWQGFLYLPEASRLELHGAGDDRLDVWIDDELVIRRFPPTDMHAQVRDLSISAGVHKVRVEYAQHGGAYHLRLEWAPSDGRPRSLSQHRIFFEPPDDSDVQLVQWTSLLFRVVLVLWLGPIAIGLVAVARKITTRYRSRPTRQRWSRERRLRAALAVALAVVSARAVVARFPGWNPESLWVDDVIFGSLIRSADLYSIITIPTHHAPGLFLIWRGFYELFPDPEWSLQVLPFACGIAAIPIMAVLGTRLTGHVTLGLVAGAVTAMNPLLSFYTVYVHQYSFEFLLTALFLLGAVGVYSPVSGIDPKRFGHIALWGGVAAFFSVASLLVSFPIVHLGTAFACCGRRFEQTSTRKILWWTIVYDFTILFAVIFLSNRSSALTREWFSEYFMPLDSFGAAGGFLAVHGRNLIAGSMPNGAALGLPEWAAWGSLPFVGVGVLWLLARRHTRYLGLVSTGIYAAVVVSSALELYPLGQGRTDVFTFPVGILLFTAGIWGVTEALVAGKAGVRLIAAAAAGVVAVTYPVVVDYRQRNDVRLVNYLASSSQPADWIVLSFSAGYLAAYYGQWDVELVPYDTSNGFVATVVRDNVLHLPLRLDYHHPAEGRRARAEHHRIVTDFLEENRPARVWFLAYYAETTNGTDWAPNIVGVLSENGYRVDRVLDTTRGTLYVASM